MLSRSRSCVPLTPEWGLYRHSGESACLADLFEGDPASYGLAKSKIQTFTSLTKIVGPMLGTRTLIHCASPLAGASVFCGATHLRMSMEKSPAINTLLAGVCCS